MVDVHRPRTRRFRVTVGVLMLAILALAGGLAWTTNRARRQEAAIARILRLGGIVGYEHNYFAERGNYPPRNVADPPAPRWLLERLGPDYFRRANFVGLAGQRSAVRAIPDLAFLDDLPEVRVLELSHTSFADSELSHARGLPLIRFVAAGSRLGDRGLDQLGRMPELWEIDLAETRVTDRGLFQLSHMPRLRVVDLRGLSVTDDGVAALSPLRELERLTLAETKVGDAGLARLRGLESLRMLDLRGTNVTDQGLVHLGTMIGLKRIVLSETLVTVEGVARLRNALPDAQIEHRSLVDRGRAR